MNEKNKKRVIIFFNNFKYEGNLLESDDPTIYYLDDFKEGKIRIPKSNSVLKELESKGGQN